MVGWVHFFDRQPRVSLLLPASLLPPLDDNHADKSTKGGGTKSDGLLATHFSQHKPCNKPANAGANALQPPKLPTINEYFGSKFEIFPNFSKCRKFFVGIVGKSYYCRF